MRTAIKNHIRDKNRRSKIDQKQKQHQPDEVTASKNAATKVTATMGNVKNENSNGGNDNRRGGQGHGKNKNMVYSKHENDNQSGFEQPIKEADIGNKEDSHRNVNGRHCYNRNSNDWNNNVRCQTQQSTINLLRTANNEANVSTQDDNAMNNNNTSNDDEGYANSSEMSEGTWRVNDLNGSNSLI